MFVLLMLFIVIALGYIFHPIIKVTFIIAKRLISFAFKAALIGIVLFLVISQLVALS